MSSNHPQLFSGPDWVPPRDVERVWKGKDRHYATGTQEPYDRAHARAQLERDGLGPSSASVLDRAITRYGPNGTLIPGLLPGWPIRKHQERPWLVEPITPDLVQLMPQDTDDPSLLVAKLEWLCNQLDARVELDASLSRQARATARAVMRRLSRRGLDSAAAAVMLLSAFRLLDLLSDGKMNGVIAWCELLLGLPAHVHM